MFNKRFRGLQESASSESNNLPFCEGTATMFPQKVPVFGHYTAESTKDTKVLFLPSTQAYPFACPGSGARQMLLLSALRWTGEPGRLVPRRSTRREGDRPRRMPTASLDRPKSPSNAHALSRSWPPRIPDQNGCPYAWPLPYSCRVESDPEATCHCA